MATKETRVHLTDEQIRDLLLEQNCKVLSEEKIKRQDQKITYQCNKCGTTYERTLKSIKKDGVCKVCKKVDKVENVEEKLQEISDNGEEWVKYNNFYFSSLGNAYSPYGHKLNLDNKGRYYYEGKMTYASHLIAKAFKIKDYELIGKKVVTHLDGNIANNSVSNLKVISRSDVNSENGKKSRKSALFNIKKKWKPDDKMFKNMEYKTIPEFGTYVKIYKNGEICNGINFFTYSITKEKGSHQYFSFIRDGVRYKVHRIVCYAFHPIKGKTKFDDYNDLEINHKNGVTTDNNEDNLEWVTHSENMKHAYDNKLNNKTREVLQYDKKGKLIKEYISIAEASRQTEEKEWTIRKCCQEIGKVESKWIWKFKYPEETEGYSQKYGSSKIDNETIDKLNKKLITLVGKEEKAPLEEKKLPKDDDPTSSSSKSEKISTSSSNIMSSSKIIEQYFHGKKIAEYTSISKAIRGSHEREKDIHASLKSGKCNESGYLWKYKSEKESNPKPRRIIQSFFGTIVATYNNMEEASEKSGVRVYIINSCLRGHKLPQCQFDWKYEESKEEENPKNKPKVVSKKKKEKDEIHAKQQEEYRKQLLGTQLPPEECVDYKGIKHTLDLEQVSKSKVIKFITRIIKSFKLDEKKVKMLAKKSGINYNLKNIT